MTEKKLYLIDGYAFAYRAYYALIRSPLVNSKGFPTGAIYGFTNYLLRLIETYKCPYLAVAMDSITPTFRHEAYPLYKANREAMPDDLRQQMPLIDELLSAFNIPMVRKNGFEADDVIASLTKKALADGFEVFLVTKDKDLMQLVGPRVRMLAPDGSGAFHSMGPDDVLDKMGVPPEKIFDFLALVGDSSDNIPGVPGIGQKGAANILERVTVDELMKNPALCGSNRLVGKIEANRDQLALSKMLATLRDDIDLGTDIERFVRVGFDVPRSLALLRELEFFSMMQNPAFGESKKFEPAARVVDSADGLRRLVRAINEKGEVALEVASFGSHQRVARLTGITLAVDTSEAFSINIASSGGDDDASIDLFGGGGERGCLDRGESLKILAEVLESPRIGKIGHDLKSAALLLRCEGVALRGLAFDTMLAAYVMDPGKRRSGLAGLVREYLGLEIKAGQDGGKGDAFVDSLSNDVRVASVDAACATLLLRDALGPVLSERSCASLLSDIELAIVPVLVEMEWQGVLIDTALLSRLSLEYAADIETISRDIFDFAGEEFNLNSPKQLADILFGKLGLKGGKKTKSGSHSTNVEVLEKLADDYPIVKTILDYREKQKLLSTYIDALPTQILPQTGRVHTSFNQAITATGRLSSTNPNLQNIPIRTESGRKIREAFIAPGGSQIVSADYSQIELRILAHLSDDPVLVQAFIDDLDIHTQTASAVYGVFPEMVTAEMRRAAKTINFGLMYGMGPINLSKQLGVSFTEAKKFIESYFNQFPSIRAYMNSAIEKAHDRCYSETLLGRRRYLPEINSTNRSVMEGAERTAINTPVQGTAADIIKIAMINVHSKLNDWPKTKMLLQVHDELVFETPTESAEDFAKWVAGEMSAAYQLNVPLKVDAGIGRHWGEAH